MQNKKMTRIATMIVGSAILLGGLIVCSSDDAQDAANNARDQVGRVAADATDKVGDAEDRVGGAVDGAKDRAGRATNGAKGKASEAMSDLGLDDAADEDVAETDLPEFITEAASSSTPPYSTEAGEFKSAEKVGDVAAAGHGSATLVESPETNGMQPLIGRIHKIRAASGTPGSETGLPTALESETEDGWEQPLTRDTMKWTSEDSQNYSNSYESKQFYTNRKILSVPGDMLFFSSLANQIPLSPSQKRQRRRVDIHRQC